MTAPPHSARFEELLPAYALGALDADDLREMEEHLAGCSECSGQLALWDQDLEALAASSAVLIASTAWWATCGLRWP